jgi:hypothetical protein
MIELSDTALRHWEQNPPAYFEEVIGVTPDPWQRKAALALQKERFVSIRSGSGVGKTALLSWLTYWFLNTKPRSKVPSTAPSQHQLFDVLWGEHFRWLNRSELLKKIFIWTQSKVAVRGYEPMWYAVARTAQVSPGGEVAEGLQGFHAEENILFIIDEASGVQDAVFPAVEGALTSKNSYVILTGNPTRTTGFFFDVFNSNDLAGMYYLMHVSCLDSPRVSDRYIQMMKVKYGVDHPVYQIKVLGNFPSMDTALLIPPEFVDVMVNNSKQDGDGLIEFGIDIGRARALSVCYVRYGNDIVDWQECQKVGGITDTHVLTQWIVNMMNDHDPSFVKIDPVGIGVGVFDNLRSIYGPEKILPVIGGASAKEDKDMYLNLRAKGYWDLRMNLPKISHSVRLPDRLIAELGDIRLKEKTRTGKIQVESKEDMMSRATRSPDHADALMYCFLDSDLVKDDSLFLNIIPFNREFHKVNKGLAKPSFWNESLNFGSGRLREGGF